MHKERECEEIAKLNGKEYKFAGTFGFIRKVALQGRDPALLFEDLSNGLMPPSHIKNVLSCALEEVDGKPVVTDHDDIITTFIEESGLQESAYVARVMLSHAMIGSIKKKQIRLNEKAESMTLKAKSFLLTNFKRLGILLGATFLAFIVLACTSFSF